MLFLTALALSIWFWRRNFKDSSVWMVLTYAGVGLIAWTDYTSVSIAANAFPKILKDFIMLGMVGFVQAMAVKKQISVWMAVVIIFGMFAAVHFLDEMINADDRAIGTEQQHSEAISLLVELKEGATETELLEFCKSEGLSIQRAFFPDEPSETLLDNYYVVASPAKHGNFERQLAALPTVNYLEPNETIQVEPFIAAAADPTSGKSSLSINDPLTSQQWAMEVLDMDAYYRLLSSLTPNKQAKVVILDTGVDGNHEDLVDNYFSIESKYDDDPHGHGTHCAGIAAGVTNNGLGIGSLAGNGSDSPFVEVSSVKVLSQGGMGTQKTIIAGILEATDEGADVISLSLGGRSNQSSQRAYSAALKYAHRNGVIVVAAAGNSNRDAKDYAPANADGMITVAAIDQLLLRAPFSNRTQNIAMSIAAPGVNIFSTVPANGYKSYSGTSMACPFVAGLLGVMKSIDPDLNHEAAYRIIQATGRESSETRITGRIVQPAAALAVVAGK